MASQLRGVFREALAKWESIKLRWPSDALTYCRASATARGTGRLAYANTVIKEALVKFPKNRHVIAEAAQISQLQGDWGQAAELWSKVVGRPNAPQHWRHSQAQVLLLLGRLEDAEALIAEFERLHPNYRYLLALRGMLAAARQQWDLAVETWTKFREAFHDDPVGWEHYGRAHQAREMARLDELFAKGDPATAYAGAPAYIEKVEQEDVRDLLLTFDSIGRNCEFGLVQRRFNCEPLGILRFGMVNVGSLITAVSQKFAGLGEPEFTELIVLGNGEYFLQDRRWGLGSHTFIFRGQTDAESLYEKSCRRWAFLREKMLTDLRDGRKVCVFYDEELSIDDLYRLHRALKEIGDVVLLHVRPTANPLEAGVRAIQGSAIQIAPRLFVGYLRRGGVTSRGTWDIAFDDWVAICSEIRRVVRF